MTFRKSGNNIFITRGDTPTLVFNANKYPEIDLTGAKLVFIVKKNLLDSDTKIIIRKEITFNLLTRIAQIDLTIADTTLPLGKYFWGAKLLIGNSYQQTTAMGELTIEGGISDV